MKYPLSRLGTYFKKIIMKKENAQIESFWSKTSFFLILTTRLCVLVVDMST